MSKGSQPNYGALAEANKYAADKIYDSTMEGISEWKRQYKQSRADIKPWYETGKWALDMIGEGLMTDFKPESWDAFTERVGIDDPEKLLKSDPGYAFRVSEGEKAIKRHAAAGSGAMSGATSKALVKYSSDLASQEYGNARARAVQRYTLNEGAKAQHLGNLMNMAGAGSNVAQYMGGMGSQYAGATAALRNQGAQAMGAGQIGAANAQIAGQQYSNQMDQQGFSNIMSVLGLGVGAKYAGVFG